MPHIVLTEEQARILEQAGGPVDVRDAEGRSVGSVLPLSPEDREAIARSRASQAAGGPGVPSAQVQAHLLRLEEIAAREELDEARVRELLRRMRAGEEV
jgi:hypothetical protein